MTMSVCIRSITSLSSSIISKSIQNQVCVATPVAVLVEQRRFKSKDANTEMDGVKMDKNGVLRDKNFFPVPYGSRYGFTNWQMKKDYHRRECVKECFPTRMRLNAIRKNNILPEAIRQIADEEIKQEPRNSNPIRTVNRCVMTSRPRGCKTRYHVSRIMYKHFADYNYLSGVTRAVW